MSLKICIYSSVLENILEMTVLHISDRSKYYFKCFEVPQSDFAPSLTMDGAFGSVDLFLYNVPFLK